MEERHSVRYDTHLLPKSLRKVTVSWGVDSTIESDVANFCTHGMKVIIPPLMSPTDIPKRNGTIKVKLPIVQIWLSGMCIYVTNELDASVCIGIYYYVPIKQNYLNKLMSKTLNVQLQTCSLFAMSGKRLLTNHATQKTPSY